MNKKLERFLSLVSGVLFVITAFLAAGAFGLIKTGWVTFTATFTGIATLLVGVMLIVHTFLIGKKVNLKKDTMPKVNLGTGIAMMIFGLMMLLGQPSIVGVWVGVLAVGYSMTAILLGRELVEDLINA